MTDERVVRRDHVGAPDGATTSPHSYDVSGLPTVSFGLGALSGWGTIGFMVIEGMTLAICAVSYLYLRQNFVTWPPFGTARPSLGVPVAQLVVMFVSVVTMEVAARAGRRLELERARTWLAISAVVKAAILVLRWYEFRTLNTLWDSNAYGSIAWATLGFHATLLLVDFGEDVGLLVLLYSDRVRGTHLADVVDDAMYWYFVVASWVPLFVLVYLLPWM